MSNEILIAPVLTSDVAKAYPLIRELRPHLDLTEFLRRLQVQRELHQYELLGAYANGTLQGLLGMRVVHTLSRGAHLHVDDLIVTDAARTRGLGRALLERAENEARARGLASVYLDSRPTALGFYEKLGYRLHPSPLVYKELG
jgi:ribosomal protein S18 acetylase RimI-like enzyme